ncbi:hypothetical protein PGT21_007075 [Puccinia graminis f. sp. tritici]|uniref:Uncharacterized protein n=1 Tax=Puccinia graminis f. sp. tritici TaxID=56615 RepID=A0A5B0Q9Q2_PUCGR|nr:hypothetical protein PGT21_007075 [Puccinia graminis f. sp. tritici]
MSLGEVLRGRYMPPHQVQVLLNRMATEIKEDMNQLLRGSEASSNRGSSQQPHP